MASLAFFAYFFLGIGPGIVFFLYFIAPKSFLVLLSFTSAFYWLLVLLITSAIFRGFLPVAVTVGSYAGLIVGAVACQELARYGLWKIHVATGRVLEAHARVTGHHFDALDRLYLALGWGYGHGAAHVIFFVLSFLPLTTSDGTWYYDQCPSMNIFLAGALYALAFGSLLPSLMVLAWEGAMSDNKLLIAHAPLAHLGASLLTLLNFRRNGCVISLPILLAVGIMHMVYAAKVAWRRGGPGGVSRLLGRSSVEEELVTGPISSPINGSLTVDEQPDHMGGADGVPGTGEPGGGALGASMARRRGARAGGNDANSVPMLVPTL